MPSDAMEFFPWKLAEAFNYVRDCFDWLVAGGGDLERLSLEPNLERIARDADRLLSNIRYVRNRLAPVNRLPPELLGVIFEHTMNPHLPATAILPKEMECRWPVVQSVCRHWRYTAVHTPVLWSYVDVRFSRSSFLDSRCGITPTIFARSGVLPLDLRLRGDRRGFHRDGNKSLLDELASNSWRIREIHVQWADPFVLDSCLHAASQLETLVLVESRERETYSVVRWQVPNLHTLVAENSTGWHGGVFRSLRHLILEAQRLTDELLRGLHTLLGLNPRLEDLVLVRISDSSDEEVLEMTLDALPSLSMPGLRRISVQICSTTAETLVLTKLVLQEGYAKSCDYPIPAHHLFPLRKVFITGEHVVGTDGQSSFYFRGVEDRSRDQCAALSWQPHIQELWLAIWPEYITEIYNSPFNWMLWFKDMKEVKKLVLTRDTYGWLDYISEHHLFPSLTELQIHTKEYSLPATIHFLKKRTDSNPIQTLRFVRDTAMTYYTSTSNLYFSWKEDASVFTQFVPNVVFEDQFTPSLRMELPVACTTSSAVHGYWASWEMDMYA